VFRAYNKFDFEVPKQEDKEEITVKRIDANFLVITVCCTRKPSSTPKE